MIYVIVTMTADGIRYFANDRPGGSWRVDPTYLYSWEAAMDAKPDRPSVRMRLGRAACDLLMERPLTADDLRADAIMAVGRI